MRMVLLAMELIGFAALVLAGFLVTDALGFAVLGIVLVLIGNTQLPKGAEDESEAQAEE